MEPNLVHVKMHAHLKFGFSGRNEPRTCGANTELQQRLILITNTLINIGFVICSVSSVQCVLQTPFSSDNLPDALCRTGPEELDSSTWKVLRHHGPEAALRLPRIVLRRL